MYNLVKSTGFFLSFMALLITACGQDNPQPTPPVEYPQEFVLDRIEVGTSELFNLLDNGYQTIELNMAPWSELNTILVEEGNSWVEEGGVDFDKFIILGQDEVEVFSQGNSLVCEYVFLEPGEIRIFLEEGNEENYFDITYGENQLSLCMQNHIYSYIENGEEEYSPSAWNACNTDNYTNEELINHVRNQFGLQTNDKIAITYGDVIWEKQ